MRVLVSGFQAFGSETVNPTEVLVGELQAGRVSVPSNIEVRGIVLPVTYREAARALSSAIDEFDPSVVISFGLASGRSAVEFERVALNCIDSEIADNAGEHLRDQPIEPGGEPAYFATLPLRALALAVESKGIPARISNTAGLFVCNFLMYRLLEKSLRTTRRCGFVHLPLLDEQAQGRVPPVPSLPLESLKIALGAILSAL